MSRSLQTPSNHNSLRVLPLCNTYTGPEVHLTNHRPYYPEAVAVVVYVLVAEVAAAAATFVAVVVEAFVVGLSQGTII